ncbi:MAG: ATP-binding cassette domain-containing protein [Ignavibacteriaceae bacterium]|jgi:ABC-2 type transport system ATP-binding protein
MHVLEVMNLVKTFDGIRAVDDVSFTIPEGSVFGLIGRNGAGKTTTLRIMMNIYLPDSGEVLLQGAKAGQDFKDKVGYLPEERGLYKKMKVLETILFFAELKGKTGKDVEKKAVEYLKRFQIADRKNSKLEDLSKGNQQKVQFITTILHDPEFIILDEPFTGLDPINTNLFKEIILELKDQGKVIIFSTHLMDFAERMCDHITMLDKGKVILNGALSDIKAKYSQRNVSINYQGDLSFLKSSPIVEKIVDYGNSASLKVKEPQQVQELLRTLVDNNIIVTKFAADEISLQEIFVDLAGDDNTNSIAAEVKYV